MPRISPRLAVLVAAVVVVWGGAHLLGSSTAAITPAVWPVTGPASASTPTSIPVVVPTAATGTTRSAAGVPLLPGALQQLNGATATTAVGIYALLQQLEAALSSRLEQLAHQLEPGR